MANNFYRQLKKILIDNDCYFARQGKGDHEFWYSPISLIHVSVPTKCPSRHTANSIIKDAGIIKKIP